MLRLYPPSEPQEKFLRLSSRRGSLRRSSVHDDAYRYPGKAYKALSGAKAARRAKALNLKRCAALQQNIRLQSEQCF